MTLKGYWKKCGLKQLKCRAEQILDGQPNFTVVSNISGLLHVTLLAPRIVGGLLVFWKVFAPLS